jgi:hypothetical protein
VVVLSEVVGLVVAAYVIYAVTKWVVMTLTTLFAVGCIVALARVFR